MLACYVRSAAVVGRGSCWEVWFACGGVEGDEEGKIGGKFKVFSKSRHEHKKTRQPPVFSTSVV